MFDPDAVSADRLARLSRAWRLPDGVPTVVLPGRLTALEGPGSADRRRSPACAGATDRACWSASDQGRRRYAAAWSRHAQALGIADRLRLVGKCDDMPAAMMLSDVVVHASTQAGGVRPRGDRGAGDGRAR